MVKLDRSGLSRRMPCDGRGTHPDGRRREGWRLVMGLFSAPFSALNVGHQAGVYLICRR